MADEDIRSVWHYLDDDDELYLVWQDALNEKYARDDDVLCAEDWLLGALAHVAGSTREQEFARALRKALGKVVHIRAQRMVRGPVVPQPIAASELFEAARRRAERRGAQAPEVTDLIDELVSNPTHAVRLASERMRVLDVLRRVAHVREEDACLRVMLSPGGDAACEQLRQVSDPELLCAIALDAVDPAMQTVAILELRRHHQHRLLVSQRTFLELVETSSHEDVAQLAGSFLDERIAALEDADLRKSVFNPELDLLLASGVLDPANDWDLDLIEYLARDCGSEAAQEVLPANRRSDARRRWWGLNGKTHLVAQESDVDVLEDYVLHGADDRLRAIAFSRLTGWAHWERNDSLSHITNSCVPLRTYDETRARRLCDQILRTVEPDDPWREPMPDADILREGAVRVPERAYGERYLHTDVSYVGMWARREAAALGRPESVAFWLLGILRFVGLEKDDLDDPAFWFCTRWDAQQDIERTRERLEGQGIDPSRLEPILRGVLVEGVARGIVVSDASPLSAYFDAAARRMGWPNDPFTVDRLLDVLLTFPSQDIQLACARLGLLMTLERCHREAFPGARLAT